jgi:D-alanine--poly(phosphoribitol) ligase subunit 1
MTNLWTAFAAISETGASAPALILGETPLCFGELKALALRCAATLAARGVAQGDVVALQLPKRRIAYALLLGCLQLGAPYVFIDPKNPRARTDRIVSRLRPKLLFTIASDGENPFGAVVRLDGADDESWLGAELHAAPSPAAGADAAYIMFTSGSTGEPKGAVIAHRGVLSLIDWAREMVHAAPGERFTNINPLHFDNSVFDIYCGLFNGAALVPVETAEVANPATWTRIIRAGRASVMFAVPTLFLILEQLGLLTPQALPGVRTFVFGGEGYPIGRLREFHARFAGHARLINVYGPTETSCICASVVVTPDILAGPDSAFPPLGGMHADFEHAILDDRQRPVAAGQPGELWIGGPCVGLGYYANPQETAARFRQDPRQDQSQDRHRAIFYRSGDTVREDDRGRLWFLGRVDNQVKIRGHRIELEEIDLAVQSIAGVQRAVAVVVGGIDGDEIAVAYVAARAVPATEVAERCKERLPSYMCPARSVQLDELPRNANGKIDRKAAGALLDQMTSS